MAAIPDILDNSDGRKVGEVLARLLIAGLRGERQTAVLTECRTPWTVLTPGAASG